MQRLMRIFSICTALCLFASASMATPDETQMAASVQNYFSGLFNKLNNAASQHPTPDTFRATMKPLISEIDGLYGATLIDDSFVIRQVYFSRNFLARGFDLKKVKELDYFWERMRTTPTPQLSEPGHGSIVQPRLIAMRSPILRDGKLVGVVSLMVRTEAFLKATGLDHCQAYRITCRGQLAESDGELGNHPHRVHMTLPATDWLIEYR